MKTSMMIGGGILAAAAVAFVIMHRKQTLLDKVQSYGKHQWKAARKTLSHSIDDLQKDLKTRFSY
jgi:hypothetical protein